MLASDFPGDRRQQRLCAGVWPFGSGQSDHVTAVEATLGRDDPGRQQRAARLDDRADGTLVQMQRAGVSAACRTQNRRADRRSGAPRTPSRRPRRSVRRGVRRGGEQHRHTGVRREPRGGQLGRHAAGAQCAARPGDHTVEVFRTADLGNEVAPPFRGSPSYSPSTSDSSTSASAPTRCATSAASRSLSPNRISAVATVSFSLTIGTAPSARRRSRVRWALRCWVRRAMSSRGEQHLPDRAVVPGERGAPRVSQRELPDAGRGLLGGQIAGPGLVSPSGAIPAPTAPDDTTTTSEPARIRASSASASASSRPRRDRRPGCERRRADLDHHAAGAGVICSPGVAVTTRLGCLEVHRRGHGAGADAILLALGGADAIDLVQPGVGASAGHRDVDAGRGLRLPVEADVTDGDRCTGLRALS